MQFVPYRKFKGDYTMYAKELLAEISLQIKEYMEDKDIKPSNELVKKKKKMAQAEDIDLKADEDETDYVQEYLKGVKENFVQGFVDCGWNKDDAMGIIERGVYGFEKQIVLEELNRLKNEHSSKKEQDRK